MNLNPDKRQEVRRQKVNNNQSKFQVGKSVDLICQHEALNIFEEKLSIKLHSFLLFLFSTSYLFHCSLIWGYIPATPKIRPIYRRPLFFADFTFLENCNPWIPSWIFNAKSGSFYVKNANNEAKIIQIGLFYFTDSQNRGYQGHK